MYALDAENNGRDEQPLEKLFSGKTDLTWGNSRNGNQKTIRMCRSFHRHHKRAREFF